MDSAAYKTPRYFKETSGILYSYLFVLPLFLLYEVLIRVTQPGEEYIIRISVDIWFKTVFHALGFNAISATFIIAFIIGAIILFKKRAQIRQIKVRYFAWMIAECTLYAIALSALIMILLGQIIPAITASPLQEISKLQLFALSLGAGLYEELFFRVILVSLLFWIFNKIFTKQFYSFVTAVTLAAVIFSGVHYIGEFGDSWALNSFLFRFLFGLGLNLIYVKRGFGCAAWTHAIYDIVVVINL